MDQNHPLNKEGVNGISSQLSLTAIGMFVSFNKAKLFTVQSINQSINRFKWPKWHSPCVKSTSGVTVVQ